MNSMDNVCPEGTGDQYVTSPSGEALRRNFHVRRSKRIRKYPQPYNPIFGAAREWKNYNVASIVYMIQDGYRNRNVDTDDILSLLAECDAENCMDTPSTFLMRDSHIIKPQSHDPDTPTYMEALSGESAEEYFKAVDDEIQSLIRRDTWEIVLRKLISDPNVIMGTCSFKCNRKPGCKIRKFKARYCVRGDVQKRLSPKPLNSYYPVVQGATVRLMLILQCILVFQSQSIDFTNAFAQAYITSGEPVFIELTNDFKSD